MTADDTVQTLATRAPQPSPPTATATSRAMDELVDLLTPVLWHTARAQGVSEAVAQDAVQTAWLRLVENAEPDQRPAGDHGLAHRHRPA